MKKYLEDLRKELQKQGLKDEDINDIIKDHEEMILEALNDGVSEEELTSRFGLPEKLAKDLAEDNKEEDQKDNKTEKKANNNQFEYTFDPKEEDIEIHIDLDSEDINFKKSKDNLIHVAFEENKNMKDYEISFENGALKIIKQRESKTFFIFDRDNHIDIDIYLPSKNVINTLMAKTKSSDVNLNDLNIKHVNMSFISGDLNIDQLTSESIKINTVSGDLELENVYTNKLHTSQVSGDLDIKHSKIDLEFEAHTVSGDLSLNEVTCDMFELDSVSGDAEGKEFYPNTVRLKSVSGDISIKNKEKKDIKILKKATVSGDIDISF